MLDDEFSNRTTWKELRDPKINHYLTLVEKSKSSMALKLKKARREPKRELKTRENSTKPLFDPFHSERFDTKVEQKSSLFWKNSSALSSQIKKNFRSFASGDLYMDRSEPLSLRARVNRYPRSLAEPSSVDVRGVSLSDRRGLVKRAYKSKDDLYLKREVFNIDDWLEKKKYSKIPFWYFFTL